MRKTTQENTASTFDGLVIGPCGNGQVLPAGGQAAEGGAKLDLRTLDENQSIKTRAEAFGFTDEGSGSGKVWNVKDFGSGYVEVCGIHTSQGTSKFKRGSRPKKKRATVRSEMTEESIESSLRRSKKKLREKTIMLRPNHLVTLTTREAITDLDVMRQIYSLFLVSMRKGCAGLRYTAVFERHDSEETSVKKRHSLHVHMAVKTDKRLPYQPIWDYWRTAVQTVLGGDDYEAAQCKFDPVRSKFPGSIAMYLCKYLTKELDNEYFEPNKRRYWVSTGIEPPEKTRLFSPPSIWNETFRVVWEEILGMDIKKIWIPDVIPGVPPIFWMSTR